MKLKINYTGSYTARKDIRPGTIFTHPNEDFQYLAIGGSQVINGQRRKYLCICLTTPGRGVLYTYPDTGCIVLGSIIEEQE